MDFVRVAFKVTKVSGRQDIAEENHKGTEAQRRREAEMSGPRESQARAAERDV